MKVVWVSHRSGLAGAELALAEGAAALAEREVEIQAVLPWEGPLQGRLAEAGAQVTLIPHARWVSRDGRGRARRAARNLISIRDLTRFIRKIRPDVAVSNTLTAPAAAFAARRARTPHVWFIHELLPEKQGVRFDLGEKASLALVDRLSDVVLVNSNTVRDELRPLLRGELRIASYAVDVPDVEPAPTRDAPPLVVQLATLAPHKRQTDAVAAVALLNERGVEAKLRLVGADLGGHQQVLEELARRRGVDVDFAGFSDEPARELAAADVALTCSIGEAFGRTTVEAMKLGVAVVGAASGGTLEVVRDGETGLLYAAGEPADLAEKLERLVRDPGLRSELGRRGREWSSQTFTRERYADELIEAFEAARQ